MPIGVLNVYRILMTQNALQLFDYLEGQLRGSYLFIPFRSHSKPSFKTQFQKQSRSRKFKIFIFNFFIKLNQLKR